MAFTDKAINWSELIAVAGNVGVPPEAMGLPDKIRPQPGVWLHSLERKAKAVELLLMAGADALRTRDEYATILHVVFDGPIRSGFDIFDYAGGYHNAKTAWECVKMDVGPLLLKALRELAAAGAVLPKADEISTFCRTPRYSDSQYIDSDDLRKECRDVFENYL